MTAPRRLAALLVLVAAAIVPHLPSQGGPFLYDDFRFVRDNAALSRPDVVIRAFVDPLATDPTGSGGGIYRPIRTLAFAAIRALFGSGPLPYHAANLLLHALNSLLVLWSLVLILRSAGVARPEVPAAAAALLFAASPVQGESVDWISSLDNLLFAAFCLVAIRVHAARGAAIGADLLVASLYLFALFSKEMAAPLAAILLVFDRLARRPVKPLFRRYFLCAAAILIYAAARALALRGEFGQRGPWGDSLATHAAVALLALGNDAVRVVLPLFPDPFAFDRQVAIPDSPLDGRVVASLAVALVLVAAAVGGVVRRTPAGTLVAAFLLARLPASQVPFALNIVVADRFLYLPLAFGGAALALAVRSAVGRLPAPARAPALAAVFASFLLFAFLAAVNARRFASEEALWRAVVARDPGHFRAHHGLGGVLAREGRATEAVEELLVAARLEPGSPEVLRDLGRLLIASGFRAEGADRLRDGVLLHAARGTRTESPEVAAMAFAAAEAFERDGREAEAREMLRILAETPSWADAAFFVRRGDLALALKDDAAAAEDWRRALALDPGHPPALQRLESR